MKVIEGNITSTFGSRRDPIDGSCRVHQGVDIAAPIGTSVFSPTDGTVCGVYTHSLGGLTIVIRSECRQVRYAMCHLDKVEVEFAQKITRGQLIARSGNSGKSTGPHLHYSVKTGGHWYAEQYVGGRYVDPVPYIGF